MPRKRQLSFDNLEQGIQEAESLLSAGYDKHGNWTLAQCCGHLENWLSYPMDGFPKPGLIMGWMLWVMKVTFAQRQLKSILENGFGDGLPTLPVSVPAQDDADDRAALHSLRETVQRFNVHGEEFHDSPLFGAFNRSKLMKLQLRHFEHHLGFFTAKQ